MPHPCENCHSLYFKTLETRVSPATDSILYKKRCKRCKFKTLIQKNLASGALESIAYEIWLRGRPLPASDTRLGERGRIFASEYTHRISQPIDHQVAYLHRIRKAEGQCDDRA